MQPQAPEACAACLGLDWADVQHAVGLQAAGATRRELLVREHRPEAIDAGGRTLRTRFTGQPLAVCRELHTGPSVSALRHDDVLVLFPVHPLTLARYREALPPSGATDDPTDAALQVELPPHTPRQAHPPEPAQPPPGAPWRHASHTAVAWSATPSV